MLLTKRAILSLIRFPKNTSHFLMRFRHFVVARYILQTWYVRHSHYQEGSQIDGPIRRCRTNQE